MISSPNCMKLIQHFEDLRLDAYPDIFGIPTIGWGHTKNVKLGMHCTKEQADKWLQEEIHSFESEVLKALEKYAVHVTQFQYDALVCFAYNLGTHTLVHGSRNAPVTKIGQLWKALLDKDYEKASQKFTLYINGGVRGLVIRRTAESMLFKGVSIQEVLKWVIQEQAKKK